ncbi:MAG: hypothetical protein KDK45_08900 [Leptospiraceae bacterium]|nr:hypothetical protein [Leptospiraceae bacterium]
MNGKNRMNFHDCLHSLKLSEKESMHLKRAFTAYKELFFETLENYNRWLFSIQKEIPVTKDDLQKFSDFYRSKYRIYKLLFLNSESLLENESSSSNPKLSDFQNLYHSLYRLHFSFYSSLKPEIRNRILNKLSNSPKSSDGIN